MRGNELNCLADNRCSLIQCAEARHDPALRSKPPVQRPEPQEALPGQPTGKRKPGAVVEAIQTVMAGMCGVSYCSWDRLAALPLQPAMVR